MGKYVNYDRAEEVILADYSELTFTDEVFAQILREFNAAAKVAPRKVFVLACWKNARIDPQVNEENYMKVVNTMMEKAQGVIRYEVTDPFTSIFVRTQNVKNHIQGSKALIFATKDEALAEVRRREGRSKPQ